MLGFIWNIGPVELTLIAAIAVMIFGKRLPQVAAEGYGQLVRLRQMLERIRRETGIDRELRDIEHQVRDAANKAHLEELRQAPLGLRAARDDADLDDAPPVRNPLLPPEKESENPEADPGGADESDGVEPASEEPPAEPSDLLDRRES